MQTLMNPLAHLLFQAGTFLKMRQMAILGLRCHQSRPISELKRPRILGVADLLGRKNRALSTPSLAQQELDRELNVKLKRLQRASEILKNLSEEEQQRLNNLKMEYEVFKAKLFPVGYLLTLNAPIATKVVCFSYLLKCLRSLYDKQCGPRSDCSYRSSLFWVHAVCFYT